MTTMAWKPVSKLPDTDELVLAVSARRRNRFGKPEPLLFEYAADILRRDLLQEPAMPRHLQLGITHFITAAELFAAVPLPTE